MKGNARDTRGRERLCCLSPAVWQSTALSLQPNRVACVVVLSLLVFPASILTGQNAGGYQGIEEKLPIVVAIQPVPFSHRAHAAAGLSCRNCHRDATKKERAGLPNTDQCLLCHATVRSESPSIRKLAKFLQNGEQLRWVRVYQVPDFVFFSHASHLEAGIACKSCHGQVEQRDVLAKEVSTSMTACMNCHLERKASNECFLCHELGQ